MPSDRVICAGCKYPIQGRYRDDAGRPWHHYCAQLSKVRVKWVDEPGAPQQALDVKGATDAGKADG